MEEIKKCIREAGTIFNNTAGVLDYDGVGIACTDEKREGTEILRYVLFFSPMSGCRSPLAVPT